VGFVTPEKQKRPLSSDQKRARSIILITVVVIAVLALGVGWLATSIGAPLWLAIGLVVVIAAVVGLFMFLELS
jgi:membrane protein YdbS with pleckstrin-like domain